MLDTNILLHLLRGKKAAEFIEREHGISARSPRAIISVVTKGELKALGYKFDWGPTQHERLDAMLARLPAADISQCGMERLCGDRTLQRHPWREDGEERLVDRGNDICRWRGSADHRC